MMRPWLARIALCLCLALASSACGNKGPLTLPDEKDKKTQSAE